MKTKILALVFAFLLLAFTIYAVLDTFVISRVYQTESTDTNMFRQSEAALAGNDEIPDTEESEETLPEEDDHSAIPKETPSEDDTSDNPEETPSNDDTSDNPTETTEADERGDSAARENWTSSDEEEGGSNDWENRTSSDNNDGDSGDSGNWNNTSEDNDNRGNWGNSSGNNTNDQDNWWSDNNDNGDSNGWGNDRRSRDNNNGDSGNWSWDDDTTNDGPVEIDVTKEDALDYEDENIRISINLYEVNDSTVYAADVQISSAEYFKSAFAKNSYGRNVTDTTSDIAAEHNAIFAVNGDYYGARESGYVIRNGIVYRESADDADVLCIYADGNMTIVDPSEVTAQELVDQGVWQAYSFGPALVIDGEIESTSGNTNNSGWRWGWGSTTSNNPRTAIGIYEPLHYLFVVSDGRTNSSEGLTLTELAEFMQSMGVTTAYNLDGGGSSTMVFQDEVINKPTTYGSYINERNISDIIYIGY